jgi:predicted phosphodiesterase
MFASSGDRESVRKLLADTVRQLEESPGASAESFAPGSESGRGVTELRQALDRMNEPSNQASLEEIETEPSTEPGERAISTPYTPRDQVIALVQSAMDDYLAEKGVSEPAATFNPEMASIESGEAATDPAPEELRQFYEYKQQDGTTPESLLDQYDTIDPRWGEVLTEKLKVLFKGKHPFVRHASPKDFRFAMKDKVTIAIVGDWGGGNKAAQDVARQIKAIKPDHVIHLGDVYYAGTPKEVEKRFLKFWPAPAEPGLSFALNSNHEMYSGGYGYFDTTLTAFKQPASYFNLANSKWQLLGLDTGYDEHDLHEPQGEWLKQQLDDAGGRRTILLSHHQLFSAYEKTDTSKLEAKVLPVLGRIFGWIWGHEHLAVVYKLNLGIRAICLGNGCFPYKLPTGKPPLVDWIDDHKVDDFPYSGGHTFALLKMDGAQIDIDFIDETGKVQKQIRWE